MPNMRREAHEGSNCAAEEKGGDDEVAVGKVLDELDVLEISLLSLGNGGN